VNPLLWGVLVISCFVFIIMPDLSFQKLDGTNYAEWSMLMQAWLIKKGLWDVVDGTKTKLPGSPTTKAMQAFAKWQAEGHRLFFMLRYHGPQLVYIQNQDPMTIWDNLTTIYQEHGFATHCTLCCRMLGLRNGEEQSMPAWITQVCTHTFKLKEIGDEVSEDIVILVLTGGLLDEYSRFITTLNSTPPDAFTLKYVISCLLNKETCHIIKEDLGMALTAKNLKRTPLEFITCFKCERKGHYQTIVQRKVVMKGVKLQGMLRSYFEGWLIGYKIPFKGEC
jgi:hypothetical protein